MQVSIESSEGLERRMTVELPAEKVNAAVEKRLKEVARNVRMDGFRPGKVPMSVVRKRFAGQVSQEVFGDLVQSSYFEALSQEKLVPAGEPSIEPLQKSPDEGMGYIATFEVMPEIVLQDLGASTITRPVTEVTDEDLTRMIEKLRKQQIRWNEVERASRDGDRVTINFKGLMDGVEFDGGSAEAVPLVLGSGSMIDGFESGLVGAAPAEQRSLDLQFPEDYQSQRLAGKPVTFEVEVLTVAEPELPEVDDEFAKRFGVKEGGVEALHKEIRENMERELQEKIHGMLKEQAMDALLAANQVEVPKALVQQEAKSLLEQTKANMQRSGQGSKLNLPVDIFEEQAKKRVSLGLIIGEVINQNGIKLDQDRVRAKVEQFAQSYEHPQEVIDYYYSNKQQLQAVENVVLEEQVVDWVLAQAKVEDTAKGFDEVMNPQADDSADA